MYNVHGGGATACPAGGDAACLPCRLWRGRAVAVAKQDFKDQIFALAK